MPASNSGRQRLVVDVLDAQQETAAAGMRALVGDQRGIGVAEMQVAGRARREAGHRRRVARLRQGQEI